MTRRECFQILSIAIAFLTATPALGNSETASDAINEETPPGAISNKPQNVKKDAAPKPLEKSTTVTKTPSREPLAKTSVQTATPLQLKDWLFFAGIGTAGSGAIALMAGIISSAKSKSAASKARKKEVQTEAIVLERDANRAAGRANTFYAVATAALAVGGALVGTTLFMPEWFEDPKVVVKLTEHGANAAFAYRW